MLFKTLLSLAFGGAVFLALGTLLDLDATLAALARLEPSFVPAILALVLGNYALRFLKWHYYLGLVGTPLSVRDSASVFFSGFMMAVTPGKLGEVLKAYLIKRMRGVNMRHTAPVILAERITDVLALMALCLAGTATLAHGGRILVVTSVLMTLLILALSSRRLANLAIATAEKVPVLSRFAHKLDEAYTSMTSLLRLRALVLATLVSIPAWGCECVAFYVVLRSLGDEASSLAGATFIYAFATLIGAVSMVPGGLGATEGSLAGLVITLHGTSGGVAAAATVVIRVMTLWFAVALGAIVFGLERKRFGMGFDEAVSLKADTE